MSNDPGPEPADEPFGGYDVERLVSDIDLDPFLGRRHDPLAEPLDELTRLYQAARYRPAPAGPEAAERAQRALATALAALHMTGRVRDALDPRQRE